MDSFELVLGLISGLALFLYGMHLMGEGLESLSGNKLEKIIEKLTSNPIKGVALGAGVTALIQSSSATTVMVVGFVNSGVMKLSQAIGIIMGANIGTTITSWLLSLNSISSDNFVVTLFKPSTFSPFLALIAIILILRKGKTTRSKSIGLTLMGFAILMIGMASMSSAVSPLRDNSSFISIITMFNNPIVGVLTGILLTAVIQSSSASVGILQALAVTGAFSYSSVIPIIMGQNIGTCVTAMLSSVGASRSAKRTAFVHLYFNVIGTVLFMAVYFSLNKIIGFSFANSTANAAGIAVVHTIFNISTTVILLPFTKLLAKLAYMTLPLTTEEQATTNRFSTLEDRFLASPAVAITQTYKTTCEMAKVSQDCILKSIELHSNYSNSLLEGVYRLEEITDEYDLRLNNYITKINGCDLNDFQSRQLSINTHIIVDLERLGDQATNIGKIAKRMKKNNVEFTDEALAELTIYQDAVKEIVSLTISCYLNRDQDTARRIQALEEVIDQINKTVKRNHLSRLSEGNCSVESGFFLSDLTTDYERVADHCSNISINVLQLYNANVLEHGYAKYLDKNLGEELRKNIQIYKKEYPVFSK